MMFDHGGKDCPSEGAIRAFAARPMADGAAEVAAHVFACPRCQRVFEDALYPPEECSLTDGERATIASFVAARCKAPRASVEARLGDFVAAWRSRFVGDVGGWRLAAAPRGGGAPSGRAEGQPRESVVFVFESDEGTDERHAWRAEMVVPADAKPDTSLGIAVCGRGGEKVPAGVFRIAGVALPVAAGAASLPFGMFLSGMKESTVQLRFPDGAASNGSLVFF